MTPAGAEPGPGDPVALPDAAATRTAGAALAAYLRAGDVVVLTGDLGAGKTTFTQGLGVGLGVRGPVTSPTFVIARVHPSLRPGGGPALVHADAYRLGGALEFDDLDLDTDLAAAVVVVEWGEGLAEGLSGDLLYVRLAGRDEQTRTLQVAAVGGRWSATQVDAVRTALRDAVRAGTVQAGTETPTAAADGDAR